MLSQNQVVAVRNAIETTYNVVCDIVTQEKYIKANKTVGFKDKTVCKGIRCRLSVNNSKSAINRYSATQADQNIKVFIAPDISVQAGSKLIITQNGITGEYINSGEPSVYSTHQEISLEKFKEWI